MKKRSVLTFALLTAFTLYFGALFSACEKTPSSKEELPPEEDHTISVSDFCNKYPEKTDNFLKNAIFEKAITASVENYNEENILEAFFDLGDGSKNTLASVTVAFTYIDGNDRHIYVNEMTFSPKIRLYKIRKYNPNDESELSEIENATVKTKYSFKYSTDDNYNSDEIDTVYNRAFTDSATNFIYKGSRCTKDLVNGDLCNVEIYKFITKDQSCMKAYTVKLNIDYSSDPAECLENDYMYEETEVKTVASFGLVRVYKAYENEVL